MTDTFRESSTSIFLLAITVMVIALSASYHWPGKEIYLIALPIGMVFIPIAMAHPQIVLLIVIALVPLDTFSHLIIDSNILTITKIIFPFALGGLMLGRLTGKIQPLGLNTLDKWILLWFSLCVVLTINAVDVTAALEYLRRIISMVLLYYVVSRTFISVRWNTRLQKTLIYAGAVSVLFGLYAYFSGNNPFNEGTTYTSVRITGAAHISPNFYAIVLLLPTMLAFGSSFSADSNTHRQRYLALTFLLFTGIALTYSRSSYLGLAGALMLAPLVWHKVTNKRQWIPLLIILTVGLLFLPLDFWQRILSLNVFAENAVEDYSLSRRFNYLLVGANIFKEFPILGAGPGNYMTLHAMPEYQTWSSLIGVPRLPHNTYLQAITETGLLGFLVLSGVFISAFRCAFKYLQDRAMCWLAGALILTLCTYTFLGMFANLFMNKYLWLLLAMIRTLPILQSHADQTHHTDLR